MLRLTILLVMFLSACSDQNSRRNFDGPSANSNVKHTAIIETSTPEISEFTLKNGLTVVVSRMAKHHDIGVSMIYNVGTFHEEEGQSEYTHLIEHLMFRGSRHAPEGFMAPLKRAGVTNIDAGTSYFQTSYSMQVPKEALELALFMESDRMGYALSELTDEKIKAESQIVVREAIERMSAENLAPGSEASIEAIEGIKSLEADLGQASIEEIEALIKTYYHPGNAVLSVVGNIDVDTVYDIASKYFSDIAPQARLPEAIPEQAQVVFPNEDLLHARIIGPGIHDAEHAAFDMFSNLLTANGNGFLRQKFVETGKAKSVFSLLNRSETSSSLEIVIGPNDNMSKSDLANGLAQVLQSYIERGPEAAELEAVLTTLSNQNEMIFDFPVGSLAGIIGSKRINSGRANDFVDRLEALSNVTPKEVQHAVQHWVLNGAFDGHTLKPFDFYKQVNDLKRPDRPRVDLNELFKMPKAALQSKRFTLSNGIPVQYVEIPEQDYSLVAVRFKGAGNRTNIQEKAGLPDIVRQMMTPNSDLLPAPLNGYGQDAADIEKSVIVTVDEFTGSASLNIPNNDLISGLEQLSNVVRYQKFEQKQLQTIMDNFISVQNSRINDKRPKLINEDIVSQQFYPEGHGLRNMAVPRYDVETIQTLSLSHVQDFYDNWYHPELASFIFISSQPFDKIKLALDREFGGWSSPQPAGVPSFKLEAPTKPNAGRVFLIDSQTDNQATIFGTVFIQGADLNSPLNSEAMAVKIASSIIGGEDLTSRLNQKLRNEKGWTYGVTSNFRFIPEGVFWDVRVQISPEQTTQAFQEILRELNAVQSKTPIQYDEMQISIAQHLIREKNIIRKDSPFENLKQIIAQETYNLPSNHLERRADKFLSMTEADIQTVVPSFDPNEFIWVISGNADLYKTEIEKLGWTVVSH